MKNDTIIGVVYVESVRKWYAGPLDKQGQPIKGESIYYFESHARAKAFANRLENHDGAITG